MLNRTESTPIVMDCIQNLRNLQPVELTDLHKIWFGQVKTWSLNVISVVITIIFLGTIQYTRILIQNCSAHFSGASGSLVQTELLVCYNYKHLGAILNVLIRLVSYHINTCF